MKPYQSVPIAECGEPLSAIPETLFALASPHPYQALDAPYGGRSPYSLREGIVARLVLAHARLQQLQPGWRLRIHDAYRPVAVQRFMVEHAFGEEVRAGGRSAGSLDETERARLMEKVLRFWAIPSDDAKTPPPHSTAAAVDVTLVDRRGELVDMGCPIDELSERADPGHFASSQSEVEREYSRNRETLREAMEAGEFLRHPAEWWHFSFGDQLWAWLRRQEGDRNAVAVYGRCEGGE